MLVQKRCEASSCAAGRLAAAGLAHVCDKLSPSHDQIFVQQPPEIGVQDTVEVPLLVADLNREERQETILIIGNRDKQMMVYFHWKKKQKTVRTNQPTLWGTTPHCACLPPIFPHSMS
jgi:hypothetical protein